MAAAAIDIDRGNYQTHRRIGHLVRPAKFLKPTAHAGGNPDSNTLISDMTTVICLDDYHAQDRNGRKTLNITALCPEAQNFELMYQHVKALKEGKAVDKPIYNHVSGLLDPTERIESPDVSPGTAP